jgi:carboxymethylenebutenolidase
VAPKEVAMATVDLARIGVDGVSRNLTGYLARPDGDGPWPGLVVVHEAFGIDDVMRGHTQRLARAGHLAMMPDLFTDGGPLRCLRATFRALSTGEGRPLQDLEAARRWLLASPDCTGRLGVIGFCMGGGFALLLADRGYDATAPNYGPLPRNLDEILGRGCPLVASYGGRDRALRGAASRLDAAAERAGVPHDVKEYADAGHSFLNPVMNGPRPLRPLLRVFGVGPEPRSAADAWLRIEAFFARYLTA